ncbi:hypothetical protein ACFTXM_26000 [Streptomyces sp. NPDC056930]|uniref:hypothetical protein n=1 Tax=Streptomyces sp. NPDC056930 TaxID=3345967 RepID=UPI003635D89F
MSLPDGRHGPASCAAASAGTTVPAATTAEAVAAPEHMVVPLPADTAVRIGGPAGDLRTVKLNGRGRYVRIQLEADNTPLSLAEVEVYVGQPAAVRIGGSSGWSWAETPCLRRCSIGADASSATTSGSGNARRDSVRESRLDSPPPTWTICWPGSTGTPPITKKDPPSPRQHAAHWKKITRLVFPGRR